MRKLCTKSRLVCCSHGGASFKLLCSSFHTSKSPKQVLSIVGGPGEFFSPFRAISLEVCELHGVVLPNTGTYEVLMLSMQYLDGRQCPLSRRCLWLRFSFAGFPWLNCWDKTFKLAKNIYKINTNLKESKSCYYSRLLEKGLWKLPAMKSNVSATSTCGQKIFLAIRCNCDVSSLVLHACPVYSHSTTVSFQWLRKSFSFTVINLWYDHQGLWRSMGVTVIFIFSKM